MRNDLIELLALLVSVGYIKSFRVTKNYIYVTMKNDRQCMWRLSITTRERAEGKSCQAGGKKDEKSGGKKQGK